MEKFTAAQARAMMPDKIKEIVERVHANIREAALEGKNSVTVTFRSEFNNCGEAFRVKNFLEKDEGYGVILSVMETSFSFCINWREH